MKSKDNEKEILFNQNLIKNFNLVNKYHKDLHPIIYKEWKIVNTGKNTAYIKSLNDRIKSLTNKLNKDN